MKKKLLLLLSCYCLMAKATIYQEWMKELDDNTLICNLSIPGSHDSGTKGFGLSGETQKLTFQEQLDAGVRAFDLRPGISSLDGEVYIFHSALLHSDFTFADVFNTLTSFLDKHPSECIFISMKKEASDQDEWAPKVRQCLSRYKKYFADLKEGMTLGDLRGKIFLMSRDTYDTTPYGTYFVEPWNDNGTAVSAIKGVGPYKMTVNVQDRYNNTWELDSKKNDLVMLMEQSMKGDTNELFINHTSGYTGISVTSTVYLADCAAKCNKVVLDYLKKHTGPVGLIMSDFVAVDKVKYYDGNYATSGKQLIDALINNNFEGGIISAIETISHHHSANKTYSISGIQTDDNPTSPGIYIRNGRKFVVR